MPPGVVIGTINPEHTSVTESGWGMENRKLAGIHSSEGAVKLREAQQVCSFVSEETEPLGLSFDDQWLYLQT